MSEFPTEARELMSNQQLADEMIGVLMHFMAERGEEDLRISSAELRESRESWILKMVADPVMPDVMVISRIPRFIEHEEAKPGAWLHTMSGRVVWLVGVTQLGTVHVIHDKDTDNEHRAPDERVEDFLKRHVWYSNVPFLGGEAAGS